MGKEPNTEGMVMNAKPNKSLETIAEFNRRAQDRINRGMSRERAWLLTTMEMQGKISIVKG